MTSILTKKTIVALFVALFVLVGGTAFGINTLTLQGTVAQILTVDVVANGNANTLDLISAQTDLLVATVTEKSNSVTGYTITLASANAAAATATLNGTTGGNTDNLTYTIEYGSAPVGLTLGAATVTDTTGKTAATGDVKNVTISFDGTGSFLSADTYEDTLTFTIAAK